MNLHPDGSYSRYDATLAKEVPLTKEEYGYLQKEYEGNGQIAELDWKPLEEYGG